MSTFRKPSNHAQYLCEHNVRYTICPVSTTPTHLQHHLGRICRQTPGCSKKVHKQSKIELVAPFGGVCPQLRRKYLCTEQGWRSNGANQAPALSDERVYASVGWKKKRYVKEKVWTRPSKKAWCVRPRPETLKCESWASRRQHETA